MVKCDANTFEEDKRTLSLLNNDISLHGCCLPTNLCEAIYLSNIDL